MNRSANYYRLRTAVRVAFMLTLIVTAYVLTGGDTYAL